MQPTSQISPNFDAKTYKEIKSSLKINSSEANHPQTTGNLSQKSQNFSISCDFKCVTEAELQAIVKRVKRTRQKNKDEEKWQNFLKWKQSQVSEDSSDDGVCQKCAVGTVTCCSDRSHVQPSISAEVDQCKDMQRVEKNEVQASLITSTVLGSNVSDNIGQVFQLGGVLTKRLQDLVATVGRMTSLLLSSVPTRSAQYEDEDVDRAIKRSMEFDAMFARNHLYEIQRLLKDAKQLAAGKSSQSELETKISAALKCVMQAIQVYAKHVSKGARVKYQQVVPIFQSISTLHGLLEQMTGQRVFPFRQELEVSSSYMKQVLLEMSTTDTQSVSALSRKGPSRPKPTARHKPSADLSMYNRRRADWRRKTASLARSKFGPPSDKKNKKTDSMPEKQNVDKSIAEYNENNSQHNFKVTEKFQGPVKESLNTKEVPYRNATRAVPEDNITTMMEIIPNEVSPSRSKPPSARSNKGEHNNVQLICLKEDEDSKLHTSNTEPQAHIETEAKNDGCTILTIGNQTKTEAMEYRQRMIEYQNKKSHYKDGKALGIVDRLATRILTEMVMDFQKEEMYNVIQTLYNLEFQ